MILHSEDDLSVGFKNRAGYYLYRARSSAEYRQGYPETFDDRIQQKILTIDKSTFDLSIEKLDNILTNNFHTISLISLYYMALFSLQNHDYPSSLITSWTIIEQMLDTNWEKYISNNRTRILNDEEQPFINEKRAQTLRGRDYSASIRTEVLSLVNELPMSIYTSINNVRKTRNKWMHEMDNVSLNDSCSALQGVADLFHLVYGYSLPTQVPLTL